ncbi:MAG: hypothetical protein ACP5H2_06185 [Solirubrobacteraceae bacterium]
MATGSNVPPSARQLSYLRSLACRTGTSFTHPQTRAQASREIHRLKQIADTGFTFAELQAENQARELHGDPPLTYGTAVREHEIDGYGSTATWSRRS